RRGPEREPPHPDPAAVLRRFEARGGRAGAEQPGAVALRREALVGAAVVREHRGARAQVAPVDAERPAHAARRIADARQQPGQRVAVEERRPEEPLAALAGLERAE